MNTRDIKIRVGTTIILLILVLIFAVQNAAFIDIHFFRWRVDMPRSVLIFSMLLIGFIIGWSSRAIYRVIKRSSK